MPDPLQDGDSGFYGVDMARPPGELGPGLLSFGRNLRCRSGAAITRGGRWAAPWLNRLVAGSVRPWSQPVRGLGTFRDPNRFEHVYLAVDGGIYRCREGNQSLNETLPAAEQVVTPVTFLQLFNRLLVWRGRYLAPLSLSTVADGFTYLIPERGQVSAFTASMIFRDGPWTDVTGLVTGVAATGVATVVPAADHELADGQLVRVRHSTDPEYNGLVRITVTAPNTFTYAATAAIADTTADGTMSYSPQEDFWLTDAAIVEKTVTSITRAAQVATLTSVAAHGLTTGDYVVLRGADEAEYNGVFAVTVTGASTFTFTVVNSPTSPSATPANVRFAKVTRTYTGMPNGYNAAAVSNRVLLPTSYIPGASSSVAGSYTAKRDYVAPSDALDPQRFSISNEFRINQGSDDELQALVKLGTSTVICLKDKSVLALEGMTGSLSAATLRPLVDNYGIVNPHAWALAGKDLVFVSPLRGVVNLAASVAGEIQGRDIPLSAPIQPLINRIHWGLADKIRVAFCQGKLYVAVPLDQGEAYGANRINPLTQYDQGTGGTGELPLTAAYLTVGETYEWAPDAAGNEQLYTGSGYVTETTRFTYAGETMWIRLTVGDGNMASTLRQVRHGVNNAVLVYDYEAKSTPGDDSAWRAAHPAGQWQGYDDGNELCVREFVTATVNGQQRLLVATEDGYVSVYEELEFYDMAGDLAYGEPFQYMPVESEAITRGYRFGQPGVSRPTTAQLVLGTFGPRYSIYTRAEGVNEERTVAEDVERDRTKWIRPAWKAAYDDTNADRNSEDPWRQDYSVNLADSGTLVLDESGVSVLHIQDTTHTLALPPLPGRATQVRVTNDRGLLELRQVLNGAVPQGSTKGVSA